MSPSRGVIWVRPERAARGLVPSLGLARLCGFVADEATSLSPVTIKERSNHQKEYLL